MIAPWPPTRFTPPLTAGHDSLFARYRQAFRIAWDKAYGYRLDEWQEECLHAITELRGDGRLRFRQVFVSLGRQNGKTEIAAALGLLFMLVKSSGYVVGIASSAEQARLVYDRTMNVIRRNPSLAKRFDKLTDTRGIQAKAGARYELKAAKSAALQGLPIDLGLVDEVHLVKPALWTDLVNGTGGRPDCMVVGITTAGDEDSELLKRLYGLAESGEAGESFGFFIWEAPESVVPDDDEILGAYLKAANPALAAGRVDLQVVIDDVRSMPQADVVRYRLNRFTSSRSALIPLAMWQACQRGDDEPWPKGRVVFTVDRSVDWGFATITASIKSGDLTFTEVVAQIEKPSMEQLLDVCMRLTRHGPSLFCVEGYSLRGLGDMLKKRGVPVKVTSLSDVVAASSMLYALVAQRLLRHGGDDVLTRQIPRASRKNVGNDWRIFRGDSGEGIDAVMATALGVYCAQLQTETPMQIF